MAHIPDGVLSAPVLIGGGLIATAIVAAGVRQLDPDRIPPTAVLSAAFFVTSLISLPVGPTSVHLLLNGLMGLVLGSIAAPAILVALVLQAAFFGFGGVTSLGANTVTLALPALLVAGLLAPALRRVSETRHAILIGGLAGGLATAATAALLSLALALSGAEYLPTLAVVAATYAPLMVVEAAVTAAALGFLTKVKPDMLGVARPVHV